MDAAGTRNTWTQQGRGRNFEDEIHPKGLLSTIEDRHGYLADHSLGAQFSSSNNLASKRAFLPVPTCTANDLILRPRSSPDWILSMAL